MQYEKPLPTLGDIFFKWFLVIGGVVLLFNLLFGKPEPLLVQDGQKVITNQKIKYFWGFGTAPQGSVEADHILCIDSDDGFVQKTEWGKTYVRVYGSYYSNIFPRLEYGNGWVNISHLTLTDESCYSQASP